MSIKRRMRRLNREDEAPEPVPKAAAKGKAAAKPPPEEPKEKDAGLPERQWTGRWVCFFLFCFFWIDHVG